MLRDQDPDSALHYFNEALNIAEKNKKNEKFFKQYKAQAYLNIGTIYDYKGDFSIAINYYTNARNTYHELTLFDNKKSVLEGNHGMAQAYLNIGIVKSRQGDFSNALFDFNKALEVFESLSKLKNDFWAINGKTGIANSYSNIGIVHEHQDDYQTALDYYLKALELKEEINDKPGIAGLCNNIGLVYLYLKNYDEAFKHFDKSIKIIIELEYTYWLSVLYNNMGKLFDVQNKYDKAIEYYNKSIKIKKQQGNKQGLTISYAGLSDLYIKKKEYYKAIEYANLSKDIALKIQAVEDQREAYKFLSIAYDSIGDNVTAYKFYRKFILLKDSISNKENNEIIGELKEKYQAEKSKQEIEKQQILIEKQEIENEKQKTIRNAFILGFILIFLFAIILFRNFRVIKKSNTLLAEQKEEIIEKNEELNQQNEEIISQRDEIETQRDVVVGQKEQLEYIHNELTNSISYAENIQTALLPSPSFIDNVLDEYFVLYKPRDIVSGDFYWINKIDEKIIIIAADCTGHGVPGAFMSMLGISFLNDIINKQKVLQPGEILNSLRNNIISSLRQKEKSDIIENETRVMVKDGLDMSVCVFDSKTNILLFAGANNPFYYIQNKEINIVKGDKMPVSIYYRLDNFKTHKIQLNKGDSFYLFTDGFADQFGGEMEKKFNYKRFRELLLSVNSYKMSEQKEQLNNTIEKWKGKTDQIDDILVLGIRI